MAYELSDWDLSELHTGPLEPVFKEIEKRTAKLESHRDSLSDSILPDQFMHALKEFEALDSMISKLHCFAFLKFSEDSSNQDAAADKTKIQNFLTKISNKLLFFGLWFKSLPDEKAEELIKASGEYHYFLEVLRKRKPYMLKESEEKIINLKDDTGFSALNSVYDMLTTQFVYDYEGKKLTQNDLRKLQRDPNHEVRKKAYLALLTKYKNYKDVIGTIYKNLTNDWREENVTIRGYKNPINVRNIGNDIPDGAVEALLKVCNKNQALFQRFFELKRKKLGLDKFTRFDVYAPIEEKEEDISYNAAVDMVLEVFENFSPIFKESALKVINKNHIHSIETKNKYTGAYCYSASIDIDPYVLINYTNQMRDVSTLAHELGHAIHNILSQGQTELTCGACLPLAETASTFAEMLLFDKMLEKYPEKSETMLFSKLDDIYATIIRQATFTVFEEKAHKMMEEGKTIDDLSKVYIDDLKKQLGFEVDDIFAEEWLHIPHIFHTPFYCYSYAFGQLLVFALYETYKEEGEAFVPKMIELLSKGGSESPINITQAVGIDITSEEFWQKGFNVIEGMINKLESFK